MIAAIYARKSTEQTGTAQEAKSRWTNSPGFALTPVSMSQRPIVLRTTSPMVMRGRTERHLSDPWCTRLQRRWLCRVFVYKHSVFVAGWPGSPDKRPQPVSEHWMG
jgi:hypothetical protein